MRTGRLRIIGGQWRRRVLHFPDLDDLRPTPDRVRETLFNWLGQDLTGWTCLDLFAGSGALGFEAASRAAASVVMVERDARASRAIRDNASMLGATMIEVRCEDAVGFLAHDARRFDLVLADPPYRLDLWPRLFDELPRHLKPRGWLYVEAGRAPVVPPSFRIHRRGRAGQVQCLLLQSGGDENAIQ